PKTDQISPNSLVPLGYYPAVGGQGPVLGAESDSLWPVTYPGAMSVPRDERLSTGRIASHLLVMVAVAAILGVVVAGLAIPFVGVLGIGARNAARAMDNLPADLETNPLPQRTRVLDDA